MDRRVTELISAAERNIEERKFDAAIKKLEAAEQIDPENKSVELIRTLINSLRGTPGIRRQNPKTTVNPNESPVAPKPSHLHQTKKTKQIKSSQISSLFEKLRAGKFFQ